MYRYQPVLRIVLIKYPVKFGMLDETLIGPFRQSEQDVKLSWIVLYRVIDKF